MKVLFSVALLLAVTMLTESQLVIPKIDRLPPYLRNEPLINRPPPPIPHILPNIRYIREANPEPQGSVRLSYEKLPGTPERSSVQYQQKFLQSKDGSLSLGVGATKSGGGRVEPTIGLSGSYRFRREANPEPQGSVRLSYEKLPGTPERSSVQYQQKFLQTKDGSVSLGVGATKSGGGRVEPTIGLSGSYRFRREANPDPQGSVRLSYEKLPGTPERSSVQYQQKFLQTKDGSLSLGVGATKSGGGRVEPTFGLSGSYRFRREANPEPQDKKGSLSIEYDKQKGRPENYNIEYQRRLFESKNGGVSLGAGAQKSGGGKWDPHVGIRGEWRFRRDTAQDKKGSLNVEYEKHTGRPERYNIEYERKLFESKNGGVSLGAGAQKSGGSRWDPHVGITGKWRFRRDVDDAELEEIEE